MAYWPNSILEHLDRIAESANTVLGLTVSRAAVARAAVAAWLVTVAEQPPEIMLREIGAEAHQPRILLRSRSPMRWPKETVRHLAQLAEVATRELGRRVQPPTVIRAALRSWLANVAQRPFGVVVEEIRAAIVKRGRKRQ